MSEATKSGCSLAALLAMGLLMTLGLITGQYTPTATSASPAPYFVVEGEIHYDVYPTLGKPCYYLMSGRVLDMNGDPYTDFVVNIKMVDIDEVAPEGPGYALPGDGAFAEDGPSGWITMLPNWQVSYEIWLTNEIGGEELSPRILVPGQDCNQNWATVNFVQVNPLP